MSSTSGYCDNLGGSSLLSLHEAAAANKVAGSTYASILNKPSAVNFNREKTCKFRIPRLEIKGVQRQLHILEKCTEVFGVQNVSCLQVKEGGWFLLSFTSIESLESAVASGFSFENQHIQVIPVYQQTTRIFVKNAPFEMPNQTVEQILSQYGDVLDIRHVYFQGKFSNISTGERRVIMKMTSKIPNCVKVEKFTLWFNYSGVVKQCRICLLTDHLAADCPQGRVCSQCAGKGHSDVNCRVCTKCGKWGDIAGCDCCADLDISIESSASSLNTIDNDNRESLELIEGPQLDVPLALTEKSYAEQNQELAEDLTRIDEVFPSLRSSRTRRSPPIGRVNKQGGAEDILKESTGKITSKLAGRKPKMGEVKLSQPESQLSTVSDGSCPNSVYLKGGKNQGRPLRDKVKKTNNE